MVSVIPMFLQFLTLLASPSPSPSPSNLEKISLKSDEIVFGFHGIFTIYKNGSVWRSDFGFSPPSLDPLTGVSSKDIVIEPKTGLSARLFLPNITDPETNKLPLLIYIHGGAFCVESAFSPTYHKYVNSLVHQANVVGMSVEYSLAPEHPLPIAYEESWRAIQWAVSKSNKDEWFRKHVDFGRIFVAGDSAGANIAHNMAIRAADTGLNNGLKIEGIVLLDPLFNGVEPIGEEVVNMNHLRADKLWRAVCPTTTGSDDPLINPEKDPKFSRLGCSRVLVSAGGKDVLRDRDRMYYEMLGKSGWTGVVEYVESPGEDHVFHLLHPTSEHAKDLMKRVVSFLKKSSQTCALTSNM